MSGDYIKLDRGILQWEWYGNINTCRLFIHCLLKAYWKDTRIEGKVIPRGSFISSIGNLAIETGLTTSEIRTALKHLKLTNELTSKGTNRNTVFTVTNYDLYQSNDKQNDKQIANKSQPIDNPLTTNEEYKEREEYKEITPKGVTKKFFPPTVKEVAEYCRQRANNVNAVQFVDFYSSKGWMVGKNKMKDWKAAVRTWEQRSKGGTNDTNGRKTGAAKEEWNPSEHWGRFD